MDLSYSPEERAFQAEVRAWLRENVPRRQRDERPMEWGDPRRLEQAKIWQRKVHAARYLALGWPPEYGGQGADVMRQTIVNEEMVRARAPGLVGMMGIQMVGPTLIQHGTEEQRRRHLPKILTAEEVWCQGYSEPGAGSDLASLRTRAELVGDEFVVNGQKVWTSNAQFADWMFCLVRTDPAAAKHAGISYLLIDMKTPGITVRPLVQMTGDAGFNEVFFEDARVPRQNLVGQLNSGWQVANATLAHERNMLGSTTRTQQTFDRLLRLAQLQRRNGGPASRDPVVRQRLADLAIRVETMKLEAYRQLTDTLRGRPPGIAASVSKLVTTELNHDLARAALEILGSYGPLDRRSARARDRGAWPLDFMFSLGLIIGGGTSQIQKNIIAERGLGMPKEVKRWMMDFGLSEDQEALKRAAREFLAGECPPALVRETAKTPDGVPRALYGKMAELGWMGLVVPEVEGGLGLGTLELALVCEELGRVAAPGPFLPTQLVTAALLRAGSKAQRRLWLPRLISGQSMATLAYLEESDRHDSAGIGLSARRTRDGWRLDGTKLFVLGVPGADLLLVAARTGRDRISLFLVEAAAPGVRVRPEETVDLTRRVGEVRLRDVAVDRSALLGREGAGWPLLERLLDLGAVGIAADSLGGAARALEMAVEYSRVRQQFGRPIGSFQALKHMAAEMVAEVEPARSLVWYAAYAFDHRPREGARAAAIAKARLGDVYGRTVNRAVQMHGGIGFTWEHDLHLWFKRACWNEVAFGDPTFHRERLASIDGY